MLISGILDRDAIKDYPELCDSALDIWNYVQLYVRHYRRPCLAEYLKVFREMESNVRYVLPAVKKLLSWATFDITCKFLQSRAIFQCSSQIENMATFYNDSSTFESCCSLSCSSGYIK